jgi:hypothetical protein
MDEEHAQPRDVDADLAEITSRLGEPDATYRTNVRRAVWRLTLGIVLVLAAAGLHYCVWSGVVPWPRNAIFWKVLLIAMFGSPAAGLYLVYFAVRGMKLWVLAYPTGLFVWHRGRVVSFPWNEITAIQFAGLPEKAAIHLPGPAEMPDLVWFDLSNSKNRIFGTTISLTRIDGEQVALPSTLEGFPDLGQRVQEETYRYLFPNAWAAILDGQPVMFGSLDCDSIGITVGKKSLPWQQVDKVERIADKLVIYQKAKKKVWAKCHLGELVNLHVLMGVVAAARASSSTP